MSKSKSNVIPLPCQAADRDRQKDDPEHMIDQYGHVLRFYLRGSLPSEEDIEDIIQEVFCRALEYENLERVEYLGAFLKQTARNILIDRYRKNHAQNNAYKNSLSLTYDHSQEDTFLNYSEMARAYKEALNKLPRRCQQVFLMRRYDGLTNSEIAQILGISMRMVQKHMVKALKYFHAQLR